MAQLVDDLLYLARLDAEPQLAQGRVDLVAVLRDAVSDSLAAQPGRPTTLATPAHCLVHGDEDALRQVMGNLLGNVRTHTAADTPVSVRLMPDGATVRVEVSDAGSGMAPELVDRAFERFSRGDARPGTGSTGGGLGLAIVAEIVDAHGGTVELRSSPGSGTSVTVALPAERCGGEMDL